MTFKTSVHSLAFPLIAVALFGATFPASAQDVTSADIFSFTEPIATRDPSVKADVRADGTSPFFDLQAFGSTFGLETRHARSATGFDLDQHRTDARVELSHGDLKKSISVIRLTPSLSYVDSDGVNPALTARDTESKTGGLALGYAPVGLNGSAASGTKPEISFTLTGLYNETEATDVTSAGVRTVTRSDARTYNPTVEISKYFAINGADRKHDYRLSVGYIHRETDSSSGGIDTTSELGLATINGRIRVVPDAAKLWRTTVSLSWEIPLHEKQPPGKANFGDHTLGASFQLSRKFGANADASFEYRHTFDDDFNRIDRYQAGIRLAF